MKIYNSLTRQKEEFIPMQAGKISMYVCGPTTYDLMHIGNARPIVVFDTFRRYLESQGYAVKYVQNFTDIDDKIINKANESGKSTAEITAEYISEAKADMTELNVALDRTNTPTVTEDINEIIEMIKDLVQKNHAYETNGSVYFNTPSYPDYGILKQLSEDVESRLAEDSEKKHPTDFVLWKAAKPNEPHFPSPWGDGRPGWHIECSAMIKKHLGTTIDIHAGGFDLLFPHHENEIAQSCCANDKALANYFMHNNFINIDNSKMAKSAGNFFTIREVAQKYGYGVLRFFLLSTHYRSPINFSEDIMASVKAGYDRIDACLQNLLHLYQTSNVITLTEEEKMRTIEVIPTLRKNFNEALADDFNTALAISYIFELVKVVNTQTREVASKEFVKLAFEEMRTFANVLGFKVEALDAQDSETDPELESLKAAYTTARSNKDFATADAIRDDIKAKYNLIAEITRQGIRWKQND